MKIVVNSFICVLQGIWSALRVQRNMKIQLAIGLVVILIRFYLSITDIEWYILLLCIALGIGLELVNTAIESLVDVVTLE